MSVTTNTVLNVLDQQVHVLVDRDQTAGAYEVFEVTGPEASGPPPHAHPWSETFIVLEGEVTVLIGEEPHVIRAGERAVVPYNTVHTFQLGSDATRLLTIADGIGAGNFFHELHANVPAGPVTDETLPQIIELARRNHLTSPLF